MTDPVDPSQFLPDDVPEEIRDFLSCRSATLTLTDGELGWLESLASGDRPALALGGLRPRLSIQPGDAAGSVTLKISLGWLFSISIRVAVTNGQLAVDTSGLPGSRAVHDKVAAGVADVNDWFRKNGKQLGVPTIASGSLTLTKVDLA